MLTFLRSGYPIRLISGHSSVHSGSIPELIQPCDSVHTPSMSLASSDASSILETIRKNVPSLFDGSRSFKPSLAFTLGDVQTLFSNFATIYAPLSYDRYFIPAENGGTLAVDFASAPWLTDDAPIVIILPGLIGSSLDVYVSSAVEELIRLRDGFVKGYRTVVVNTRGSYGSPLTSAHLTHAGSTEDVKTVVASLRKSYPEAKGVFALGFSMGGALLSNYLADEGDACPLDAGFCISTVWDLEACSKQIEDGPYFRRLLYSYSCGTSLARIVREHSLLFKEAGAAGFEELLSRPLVRMSTFNDVFMSHLAGYANTAEFAAATSPIFRMNKIRRPCVLLNAQDDPLYGGKRLDALEKVVQESGQNELVLAITKRGGHVGWFQRNKEGNLEQWFIHPVREFFDAILMEKIGKHDDRKELL